MDNSRDVHTSVGRGSVVQVECSRAVRGAGDCAVRPYTGGPCHQTVVTARPTAETIHHS